MNVALPVTKPALCELPLNVALPVTVPKLYELPLNVASPVTMPLLYALSLNVAMPVTVTGIWRKPVQVRFTTVGSLPMLVSMFAVATALSPLAGRADACVVNASLVHQLPSVCQSLSTAAL